MKLVDVLFRAVMVFFALLVLGVIAALGVRRELERRVEVVATSPSGDRVAVLHALGEGETPGYGEQLVIHAAWAPLKHWWGTPIFRGYCQYPELRWKGDAELALHCRPFTDVHEQRMQRDGVRITYVGARA